MQIFTHIFLLLLSIGFTTQSVAMDISQPDQKKTAAMLAVMIYTSEDNFSMPILKAEIACDDTYEKKVQHDVRNALTNVRLDRISRLLIDENEVVTYSIGSICGTCTPEAMPTLLYGSEGVIEQGLSELRSSPYKRRLNIFYWPKNPSVHRSLHTLFPCKHIMPYDCSVAVTKDQGVDPIAITLFQKDNYCIEDVQDAFMDTTREYLTYKEGKLKDKLNMNQTLWYTLHLSVADKMHTAGPYCVRAGDTWQIIEALLRGYSTLKDSEQ